MECRVVIVCRNFFLNLHETPKIIGGDSGFFPLADTPPYRLFSNSFFLFSKYDDHIVVSAGSSTPVIVMHFHGGVFLS